MATGAAGANGSNISRSEWEAMTEAEREAWRNGPGRGQDGQPGSVTIEYLEDGFRLTLVGGGSGGSGGKIVG